MVKKPRTTFGIEIAAVALKFDFQIAQPTS